MFPKPRNPIPLLLCFAIIFPAFSAIAQHSIDFEKPYAENLKTIDTLYANVMRMDKKAAFGRIELLKSNAVQNNSQSWELEAKMLKTRYLLVHEQLPYTELVQQLEEIAQTAEEKGIFHLQARAIWDKANLYSLKIGNYGSLKIGNYELALQEFARLFRLLKGIDTHEFPNKTYYLYEIGETYYFFGDYAHAASILRGVAGTPVTEYNGEAMSATFNTLGLIYQELGKLDSSSLYFKKVLANDKAEQKELWKAVAMGNLGHNEYLLGNFDQAIPLLVFDYETADRHGDCALASGSGTTLADIYIEKGMPEKSKYYIDVSLENIRVSDKTERLRHLYPVMSKYYAEVGKPEMAKAYIDSTLAAKKRYGKKTSSIQLLRLEQKEAKRREEQMRLEQEKKTARRNALIAILIVVGGAGAAVGIVSHKKMKANQKLKSYQLEMAKYQLERFSKTIEKNNALIATLKKEKKEDASHETIQKLRQSSLLTDESWEEFQDHFNQIFPGFIQRLKTKYPSLTPTEIRYLVLAKLGFSNNKTASALGVSPSSLRVTWHRMKKKLKLSHASPKALMTKIS